MDKISWKVIVTRWTHPTMKHDDGKKVLKPEIKWSEAKVETSLRN